MSFEDSRQLEIALFLAQTYGFQLFPVNARHRLSADRMKRGLSIKGPLVKWRSESLATNDPNRLRELWKECPDAAVAIDCGKSGLLIIDADRKPGGADGITAWHDLFELNQLLYEFTAQPPIISTPNGGEHWWFRLPPDIRLGNGEGTLPDGINVRGEGGLALPPGFVIEQGQIVRPYKGGPCSIQLADGSLLPDGAPVPVGSYAPDSRRPVGHPRGSTVACGHAQAARGAEDVEAPADVAGTDTGDVEAEERHAPRSGWRAGHVAARRYGA